MHDVFFRMLPLPVPVEGLVVPNDDQTFDVYINSNLCQQKQQNVADHELKHIKKDHFYDARPVWICESEADG